MKRGFIYVKNCIKQNNLEGKYEDSHRKKASNTF